jgi:hypothetical protein
MAIHSGDLWCGAEIAAPECWLREKEAARLERPALVGESAEPRMIFLKADLNIWQWDNRAFGSTFSEAA